MGGTAKALETDARDGERRGTGEGFDILDFYLGNVFFSGRLTKVFRSLKRCKIAPVLSKCHICDGMALQLANRLLITNTSEETLTVGGVRVVRRYNSK